MTYSFTTFVRVFYQAKTYSEKDTRFLAGMIHLERLPVGTELLLHIDDDDILWTHWQFARALRQRYLPNMVFTGCAVLRSIYGQRLTPSELGSDVHAVASRKHKTLVNVMHGSQISRLRGRRIVDDCAVLEPRVRRRERRRTTKARTAD